MFLQWKVHWLFAANPLRSDELIICHFRICHYRTASRLQFAKSSCQLASATTHLLSIYLPLKIQNGRSRLSRAVWQQLGCCGGGLTSAVVAAERSFTYTSGVISEARLPKHVISGLFCKKSKLWLCFQNLREISTAVPSIPGQPWDGCVSRGTQGPDAIFLVKGVMKGARVPHS